MCNNKNNKMSFSGAWISWIFETMLLVILSVIADCSVFDHGCPRLNLNCGCVDSAWPFCCCCCHHPCRDPGGIGILIVTNSNFGCVVETFSSCSCCSTACLCRCHSHPRVHPDRGCCRTQPPWASASCRCRSQTPWPSWSASFDIARPKIKPKD